MNGFKSENEASASGALKVGKTEMLVGGQTFVDGTSAAIEFYANLFSSIYQDNGTVRPQNISILVLLKI